MCIYIYIHTLFLVLMLLVSGTVGLDVLRAEMFAGLDGTDEPACKGSCVK